VFDAVTVVFDYTAHEMEQNPRLMFELIAYIAHAKEPPQTTSISRAERLLAFPGLPGVEDVEPQFIDQLFTALLQQAVRAGELSLSVSIEAVVLLLKTMFYGVPLATRREGVHTICSAYHEVLDVLFVSLKQEERSKTYEENTEHSTGTA
jgi:hypothetical protein